MAFRKNGVEKAEGGVYGWNTKADMQEAIDTAFPAKAEKAAKPEKVDKKPKAKKSKKTDDNEE